MIDRHQGSEKAVGRKSLHPARVRKGLAALLIGVWLSAAALPATAEEYEPADAGQPLRIVAYVVHPVGVVLDYLFLRPMYWIGSHEPFRTLFGRED